MILDAMNMYLNQYNYRIMKNWSLLLSGLIAGFLVWSCNRTDPAFDNIVDPNQGQVNSLDLDYDGLGGYLDLDDPQNKLEIISPENESITDTNEILIEWQETVYHLKQYELQLSTDPLFKENTVMLTIQSISRYENPIEIIEYGDTLYIRVRVVDRDNSGIWSDTVVLWYGDPIPPVVSIGSPCANQYLPQSFDVKGTASDNNRVKEVSIIVDEVTFLSCTSTNNYVDWSCQVSGLSYGEHEIYAVATDEWNIEAYSEPITVFTMGSEVDSVYVSSIYGDDHSGSGHPQEPIQSIYQGIQRAKEFGLHKVCVSEYTYSELVVIEPGISLSGGYKANLDGDTLIWEYDPDQYKATIVGPPGQGNGAVLSYSPLVDHNTIVKDLRVIPSGVSSYGKIALLCRYSAPLFRNITIKFGGDELYYGIYLQRVKGFHLEDITVEREDVDEQSASVAILIDNSEGIIRNSYLKPAYSKNFSSVIGALQSKIDIVDCTLETGRAGHSYYVIVGEHSEVSLNRVVFEPYPIFTPREEVVFLDPLHDLSEDLACGIVVHKSSLTVNQSTIKDSVNEMSVALAVYEADGPIVVKNSIIEVGRGNLINNAFLGEGGDIVLSNNYFHYIGSFSPLAAGIFSLGEGSTSTFQITNTIFHNFFNAIHFETENILIKGLENNVFSAEEDFIFGSPIFFYRPDIGGITNPADLNNWSIITLNEDYPASDNHTTLNIDWDYIENNMIQDYGRDSSGDAYGNVLLDRNGKGRPIGPHYDIGPWEYE